VARVVSSARLLPAEEVNLEEAQGRVVVAQVRSRDDVPPFDNSAMDGFAVRAADTMGAEPGGPAVLHLAGTSRAGAPATSALGRGEAFAISTGAMMPAEADAVIRVEDARSDEHRVEVLSPVQPGTDIRRAGEDIRAGEELIRPGTRLGPAELGVLASVGVARVSCSRRPQAAILTTGDELTAPDQPLRPGAIRDSNAYSVPALARTAGCAVSVVSGVRDDRDATVEALRTALDADLVVICGGVSVGEHDHVKDALATLGVEERFWGVALRPGRPTWFGVASESVRPPTLVFGLPGNPVSALVTFRLLVLPAIGVMSGLRNQRPTRLRAVMDDRYEKQPGRLHAVRCTLELRNDGWHASTTGPQGSHILTSMLGADGLAMIEADRGTVEAGEPVEVELLD